MKPQIVFTGDSRWDPVSQCCYGFWKGKPLNPSCVVDTVFGKPVSREFRAEIREVSSGYYNVTMCRLDKHGTRYNRFDDFCKAQKHLIRWFERNFKFAD